MPKELCIEWLVLFQLSSGSKMSPASVVTHRPSQQKAPGGPGLTFLSLTLWCFQSSQLSVARSSIMQPHAVWEAEIGFLGDPPSFDPPCKEYLLKLKELSCWTLIKSQTHSFPPPCCPAAPVMLLQFQVSLQHLQEVNGGLLPTLISFSSWYLFTSHCRGRTCRLYLNCRQIPRVS